MRLRLFGGALIGAAGLLFVGCGDVSTEDGYLSSNTAVQFGNGTERSGAQRYIVQYDGSARNVAMASSLNVAADMSRLNAMATYLTAEEADRLSQEPGVEYVELDPIREPYMESTPYGITLVQ